MESMDRMSNSFFSHCLTYCLTLVAFGIALWYFASNVFAIGFFFGYLAGTAAMLVAFWLRDR